MAKYKTIETRVRGHRTICGTDWEICDQVIRDSRCGRVMWIVIRGFCNGVADSEKLYMTRRAALEAL